MRMISRYISRLSAVSVAGLIAATASGLAQETIKIGVLLDQTGRTSFYSLPVNEGSEMAVEALNAAGGVLGKKVELLLEDDNGRPDLSATKARKLIEDGVVAIISNSNSGATRQAIGITAETLTPQLASANASETLTTIENSCFFQLGPVESIQIKTMLEYAATQGFKKVALVGDSSGLSVSVVDEFRKYLNEAGFEIVEEQLIPAGAQNAIAQMQRVRAANPEAIFQVAQMGPQAVQFFQAYHQLGLTAPILGTFNLSTPSYLTTAKDLMDGTVFTDAFDPGKAEAASFAEAYQERTGQAPSSLQGYGYDSVMLIADAITRANSTDRAEICKAISQTQGLARVMGAKDTGFDFSHGDRRGFHRDGVVVRKIENNAYTPAIFSGADR